MTRSHIVRDVGIFRRHATGGSAALILRLAGEVLAVGMTPANWPIDDRVTNRLPVSRPALSKPSSDRLAELTLWPPKRWFGIASGRPLNILAPLITTATIG